MMQDSLTDLFMPRPDRIENLVFWLVMVCLVALILAAIALVANVAAQWRPRPLILRVPCGCSRTVTCARHRHVERAIDPLLHNQQPTRDGAPLRLVTDERARS